MLVAKYHHENMRIVNKFLVVFIFFCPPIQQFIHLSHFRCVELPYIQQILAGNMDVLSKLFWLTSNASDPYYGEVTTKILYCCSTHPRAAEKLIENQFYRSVLEKYEAETEKGLKSSDKEQRIMPFTPATG